MDKPERKVVQTVDLNNVRVVYSPVWRYADGSHGGLFCTEHALDLTDLLTPAQVERVQKRIANAERQDRQAQLDQEYTLALAAYELQCAAEEAYQDHFWHGTGPHKNNV